jgi:hypothetical protein
MKLEHRFVKVIPDQIEEGVLYISIEYATAIHKCVCGCKNDVVTPLSPTDWKLTYDGDTVSLYPSIGNWNFECNSHYWITNNRIKHARKWSTEEVELGRKRGIQKKRDFFSDRKEDD